MVVIGPGGWLGVGVLETEQGCAENGKDGFFHFLRTNQYRQRRPLGKHGMNCPLSPLPGLILPERPSQPGPPRKD
jgi:hypothetical protein